MITNESLLKRVLYKVTGSSDVSEGSVQEFSPTGKYVRLNYQWLPAENAHVIEELLPLPGPKVLPAVEFTTETVPV